MYWILWWQEKDEVFLVLSSPNIQKSQKCQNSRIKNSNKQLTSTFFSFCLYFWAARLTLSHEFPKLLPSLYVEVCVCVYICMCVCPCVDIYISILLYTYIYIYILIYICTWRDRGKGNIHKMSVSRLEASKKIGLLETHDKILIVVKTVFCFFTCENAKRFSSLSWNLRRSLMDHI